MFLQMEQVHQKDLKKKKKKTWLYADAQSTVILVILIRIRSAHVCCDVRLSTRFGIWFDKS